MLQAMDSAVAGLRSHQNDLNVIGNNIANVNTAGFKSQQYSFKDAMYTTSNASAEGEAGEVGGTNAAQYGFGSMTGTISMDMSSASPNYVGGFNAAINGSGFFITSTVGTQTVAAGDSTGASDALKDAGFYYTRVGKFNMDANGYLVDGNGNFVYGFKNTADSMSASNATYDDAQITALHAPEGTNGFQQMKSVSIGNDGVISGTVADEDGNSKKVVLGKVAIANFQNQEGLTKAGNNTFVTSGSDNTGIETATAPGGATSKLMAGYLEGSNVDLAQEFANMITAERGFQANAKMITVGDEVLQELVNMKR